jgi:CheY-like chemotaxis protein
LFQVFVEDNKAVRELLERVLRGAGYIVHSASTPSEARAISNSLRGKIDLLLTDVVMPEVSGPVLGRGYSGAALSQREDNLPDAVFLEKPFSSHQVLRVLRASLRDRAQD